MNDLMSTTQNKAKSVQNLAQMERTNKNDLTRLLHTQAGDAIANLMHRYRGSMQRPVFRCCPVCRFWKLSRVAGGGPGGAVGGGAGARQPPDGAHGAGPRDGAAAPAARRLHPGRLAARRGRRRRPRRRGPPPAHLQGAACDHADSACFIRKSGRPPASALLSWRDNQDYPHSRICVHASHTGAT